MADKDVGAAVPAAVTGGDDDGPRVEGVPEPTYEWMGLTNEWGVRVKPGEHGLRLGDLNVGIYGEVPEEWNDHTRRPRGALPRPGIPPLPYNLRSKHEMWADCAAPDRRRMTKGSSASARSSRPTAPSAMASTMS